MLQSKIESRNVGIENQEQQEKRRNTKTLDS
jgi:hypothetical protein